MVVPTLQEGAWLGACLAALPAGTEVIVADGGSSDDTVAVARTHGARVVQTARGRGPQLNAGAHTTKAEALLFLHADARLPPHALRLAATALQQPDVVAGCFRVRHVTTTPRSRLTRCLLRIADLRSRWTRLPYGDQALFLRREVFDAVGGFPDLPLLEDLEMSRTLAARGHIVTLPHEVLVSSRAFERGWIRHGLALLTFPLLFRLRVPAATLARWYRRGV